MYRFFQIQDSSIQYGGLKPKIFSYFDIFLIFLFKKIFDHECLPNCVYRGFFSHWLRICYQFAQIQDGGSNMAAKISKIDNCYESQYAGVFWVADYESVISFYKSKMADPIWRSKISKIVQLLYPCIRNLVNIHRNFFLNKKMADPIWRSKISKIVQLLYPCIRNLVNIHGKFFLNKKIREISK